jgi:hypothetical protein
MVSVITIDFQVYTVKIIQSCLQYTVSTSFSGIVTERLVLLQMFGEKTELIREIERFLKTPQVKTALTFAARSQLYLLARVQV